MDSTALTILILVILTALSAYFSATETAFSSLDRIRLKNQAAAGSKKAQSALSLAQDYDRVLSTILIGNNIVNIASASIATVLFTSLFGASGVSISTVVMTVVVLIFGEISPKSLAKETPESFAMFSAPILRAFMAVLRPVNFLFMQWKKLISKLFRVSADRSITEKELLTIVDEAQSEGGINAHEGHLIRSAIEFNDLDVEDILTPRVDIVALEVHDPLSKAARLFKEEGFSRLPVYEQNMDNIVGMIHEKDFYTRDVSLHDLAPLVSEIDFVPQNMKISKLLRLFQHNKNHMAVVADEFGGTMGIVTLEDVIEQLVGEIWDEHDEIVKEVEAIGDNRYRVVTSASLDKILEFFQLENDCDVTTIGGWVMHEIGRVPRVGDQFVYQKALRITVTKSDSRHALEVVIERLEASGKDKPL